MGDEKLAAEVRILAERHAVVWKSFSDKDVFLTGATGFIGSFIAHFFSVLANEHGIDVRVTMIVRDIESARQRFGRLFPARALTLIEGDVRDIPVELERADYVIHAASNANPIAYMDDPVGTIQTSVAGTANVLEAAARAGAGRFLYLSTVEAYGLHGLQGPVDESVVGSIDPTNIRNCYPLGKVCAENLSFAFGEQHGMDVVVARLAYIYGPGDNILDPKVVTSFLNELMNGRSVRLKSVGSQERSYCYIRDAACGVLFALLKGEPGEIYNVASSERGITIRGIAELATELFGVRSQKVELELPSEADRRRFSLAQNNVLDNRKIKSLGFEDEVDFRSGLIETGRYFGLEPRLTQ